MKSVDPGILEQSVCFPFTPPKSAQELFFYPVWCGHYFCTDHYFMRRMSYPPLLVAFVRKGILRVEYRGETRRAEAGDVVLLDCMEPHYYHAENGLEFLYMHFDGSNAHAITRYIIETNGWMIQRENNTLVGDLLFDMVRFYQDGGVETGMQSSMRISRLFELLLAPDSTPAMGEDPVELAVQYIRAHIGETITLEELSASVCLSVSYFSHLFKKRTGFAPVEYVINSRIERAKVLLVRSNDSIAEIAEKVGYASSGSLINLFTKRVGVSPRQYRVTHLSLREPAGFPE